MMILILKTKRVCNNLCEHTNTILLIEKRSEYDFSTISNHGRKDIRLSIIEFSCNITDFRFSKVHVELVLISVG